MCLNIAANGFGLGEVAVFEKLKMNNIMKLVSDTQLKLQGQAAILPNPLLYEVPSCYLMKLKKVTDARCICFCEAAEHKKCKI